MTDSAPFRIRAFRPDPRPVKDVFPPITTAKAVKIADLPPGQKRQMLLSLQPVQQLTSVVADEEVHPGSKVDLEMSMTHEINQDNPLQRPGLAGDLFPELVWPDAVLP